MQHTTTVKEYEIQSRRRDGSTPWVKYSGFEASPIDNIETWRALDRMATHVAKFNAVESDSFEYRLVRRTKTTTVSDWEAIGESPALKS